MRLPVSLSGLLTSQAPRRTTACGRCGDSFFGSPSAGRSWLLAHHTDEHRQRPSAPVPVTSVERPAPRLAPVLHKPLSASRS